MKKLAVVVAISAALCAMQARAQKHPAPPASASSSAQPAAGGGLLQLESNPDDWPMAGKN